MRISRAAAFAALAAGSVLVLGACSSSDDTSPTAAPTSPAASTPVPSMPADGSDMGADPAPSDGSGPMVGTDPSTWSPVSLNDSNASGTLTMPVGLAGTLDVPGDWTLSSSDESVVSVSQASSDGSATYVAGITALAPGSAQVTATSADGMTMSWFVDVLADAQDPMPGSDPATFSPALLDAMSQGQEVYMVVGQSGVLVGSMPDWQVVSSDPSVVEVMAAPDGGGAQMNVGVSALSTGTATITATDAQGNVLTWMVVVS